MPCWSHRRLVPYSLDAITTAGRYWVTARASTPGGERSARLFVKHVQSWSRSSFFQFVPEKYQAMAATSVPWHAGLVYGSDLPPTATGAHHARRCMAFSTPRRRRSGSPRSSSTTTGTPPTSPVRRTCSVGSPGSPAVAEARPRLGDADGGPHAARTYADGRLAAQAPALRSKESLAGAVAGRRLRHDLRAGLLTALDAVPSFVDELESGPRRPPTATPARTTCCAPRARTTSPSSTTGSSAGSASASTSDELLVGDVQIGQRDAADPLPEAEAACLPAYVEGLRAERVSVDADTVARAHALHLLVFSGLSAPLMDAPAPGADADALARDARERAAISRFCLDLVETT